MAEMKNPSTDFAPVLTVLQIFSGVLYLITAVAIYCLSGQYTTSRALGSAPLIPAKIAYGIVLPAILSTGLLFGHTSIKHLYVVCMRAMKSTHQLSNRPIKSCETWITCASVFLDALFCACQRHSYLRLRSGHCFCYVSLPGSPFGISDVFWYHCNWQEKFHTKSIPLAIVNALLIVQALFMNGVGLWAAITELMDILNDKERKVGGAFTGVDISLF